MTDLTGITLQNKYFLRQLIGRGGTAEVYLAWDKIRNSTLAVKVLNHELAGDTRFLRMFKQEAEFMRDLRHPNIVRLFDFGEDRSKGKTLFIVMDYIKGSNLRGVLSERQAPLNIDEASKILAAVCKALYFAHQSKVLHCDVKSANILIAQNENPDIAERDVFLADFGISHWALQNKGGGTPAYMAPELFTGSSVTERTDIYALGVTLYEILTGGQLPFRGTTGSPGNTPRERIAWEKVNKSLPPLQQFNPDLPGSIVFIVEKALNKDPKLRYASAIEIWNEFEHASKEKSNGSPALPEQKTIVHSEYEFPLEHLPSARPSKSREPSTKIQRAPDQSLRTNQPYLAGVTGEKAGQIIVLQEHELTIGRSASNSLRFEDRTVSRFHATIITSRRAYYIRDEDSSLGTYFKWPQDPSESTDLDQGW